MKKKLSFTAVLIVSVAGLTGCEAPPVSVSSYEGDTLFAGLPLAAVPEEWSAD